jgi:hypothetical protein
VAAGAPAARAGWGRPFELVKPGSADYLPTQLAFSSMGAVAAGMAIEDVDTPGSSQAYLVTRSARGAVGAPVAIGGAGLLLGLSFDRSALELLTGAAPGGLDCCSTAQAMAVSARGVVERPQTVVGGLAGATLGRLLTLADGRMVAAIATEQGVWASQSDRSGRFGGQRRLTAAGQAPQSLSAAWLGGDDSLIAWTAASGPAGSADPRSIFYSSGSNRSPPRAARTLLRAAAGHRVDELAVARRGSRATAAWVESWYDRRGGYHAQVRAADLAAHPGIGMLSPANGGLAAGLSFAADPAGGQAVAWKSCNGAGACIVQVAVRAATGTFDNAVSLGAIDASQSPAVGVGPAGQVVVGWVRTGHPVAAVGAVTSGRFGPTRVLSASVYALDLTVAFGPGRDALVAWTQGTLNPSVVAADYRTP